MTQNPARPEIPTLAPPEGCSKEYSFGWRHAERWLRNGGALEGELPPEWHPDEAAGYRDRIAKIRNSEGGQVLAFRPKASPAD